MREKSVDRMLREIMIRELVQFKGEYCMYNENYSIIFSSMTGNTRKLAIKFMKSCQRRAVIILARLMPVG